MSTTQPAVTLPQVLTWIQANAGVADFARIREAIKARQTTLDSLTAAALTAGMRVRITDVRLRPRYWHGTEGELVALDGKYGSLQLDESGCLALGMKAGKFAHLVGQKSHTVTGIPLSALTQVADCEVTD
jgi:hypothetical protein